jgi:hypothetical protein
MTTTNSLEAQPQGGEPPEQIWMSFDPELDVWFQSSEPPGCYRDKGITQSPTLYVRADLPRATAEPTRSLIEKERFGLARAVKDFLFEQCRHADRDRNYDWCPDCVMNFMELGGWVATPPRYSRR